MNREKKLQIGKGIIIILVLFAVAFALRMPAADINSLDDDTKDVYLDSNGLPYFSEMDSYLNLRFSENYVDHGHLGDEMVNGSPWDAHRYGVLGEAIGYFKMGIVYVTAAAYKVANLFGDHSVREVAFWLSPIISSLAVIPAYLFLRRITNEYGAFVASLIIVLAPNYFAHTFPGFFDTDMFYYIFALSFIFLFVESLRQTKWVWKILCSISSLAVIGLFSQFWTGFIFYVGLIAVFSIVYLISLYVFNATDDKDDYSNPISWLVHQKNFLIILLFLALAVIGFIAVNGIEGVLKTFSSINAILNIQAASRGNYGFPNAYVSVSELQQPPMVGFGKNAIFLSNTDGVVNGLGSISILFGGLAVLYLLVSRAFKYRSLKPLIDFALKPPKSERVSISKKLDESRSFRISVVDLSYGDEKEVLSDSHLTVLYGSLFVVWTLICILAVYNGTRFITTLVLPFALMTGLFVKYAVNYIKNKLENDFLIMAAIIVCAFLIGVPLATINLYAGIALFILIPVIGYIIIRRHVEEENYTVLPWLAMSYKLNAQLDDVDSYMRLSRAEAYYRLYSPVLAFESPKKVPLKKYFLIVVLVFALITPSVCGAFNISEGVIPGTNDYMWNSMTWINETQPENAVVTSWWDYGYLFEYAADRSTTFDGGSQHRMTTYFVGKALSTDDLELSAGIFRMLDNSDTLGIEKVLNVTDGNSTKSTNILFDILPRTADDAQQQLINKYHINKTDAEEIISYTHPENPCPVVFVGSSDMLQKASWWSYFGNWNFESQSSQHYTYHVATEQTTVPPGKTVKAPISDESGVTANAVIKRGNGKNDTTAHVETVYSDSGEKIMKDDEEYNPFKASNLLLIEDGKLVKNESIKGANDGNYTLLLMGNDNQYTPILMNNELVNSMFTRVYLFGGAGQDIFEEIHSDNGVRLFKLNYNNTKAGRG